MQAKSYDSKRLLSDKREILSSDTIISWSKNPALFGIAALISQPSFSSYALNPDMLYR